MLKSKREPHKASSMPTDNEYTNGLVKSLDRTIIWLETQRERVETSRKTEIKELLINRSTKVSTYNFIIGKLLQQKEKYLKK